MKCSKLSELMVDNLKEQTTILKEYFTFDTFLLMQHKKPGVVVFQKFNYVQGRRRVYT